MDFLILTTKSFFAIIVLFLITKSLGKKQINQLNMFDYVIGISIGNVVAEMSVNKEVVFIDGVITMAVYALVAIIINYLTTKSIIIRRLTSGTPIVIIEEGKLIEKGLKKSKLDINDFLEEARINGYFDISEIEYAIMEANGIVSFLPKGKYSPLTPSDSKIKVNDKSLNANVVIDGNIMEKNLKYINKDKKWLKSRLKNLGYDDIEKLLLVTCDKKEKIEVYEKNIEQENPGCLE
ncbi:MAG: DUF421 domain-containing protein [Bacilli bacterium]|nr:DUF421 domain-containing protein [Bacilli bacterium]